MRGFIRRERTAEPCEAQAVRARRAVWFVGLFTNDVYAGPKLRDVRVDLGVSKLIEIVEQPMPIRIRRVASTGAVHPDVRAVKKSN